MRLKRANPFASECQHPETIVVRSVGIERIVCESCGHVSFSFDSDLPEAIDRDRFTRHEGRITVDA